MAGTEQVRPDIGEMARRGDIGGLIQAVRGSDPDTMSDILDALIGAGEAAVPALIPALRDGDEKVHTVASIALGKIGRGAVLPLVRAFREKDGFTRVKIADILANIGDPALGEIVGALGDPDEEVRGLSALVLGEMRNGKAVGPLISALEDASENVRAQAAVSLGEMGALPAEEALRNHAENDESPAVREVAANALLRVLEVKEGQGPAGAQSTPR
ncbi:MAG TPA: HEAT repeat domain-containing protein [Methanomicrobiales archaeon]|nr:HEAT repeat domain-containing protein [Methanomicrobiales archaeon]